MSTSSDYQAACARTMYSNRASTYDASFHVYQGFDFTRFAALSHGQHVLDLAAGTGLVAIPARKAVGPTGTVTAVDITQEMLDIGMAKARMEGLDIYWHCHDITKLDQLQGELRPDGYDVITCASALALFEHPLDVVKGWVPWLRPGGILVVDFVTEGTQIAGLAMETTLRALRKPLPYNRTWVTSQEVFERLFTKVGLAIEKSFVVTGYWIDGGREAKDPEGAWAKLIRSLEVDLKDDEKEPARKMFLEDMKNREGSDAKAREEGREGFYTVVARKP